MFPASSQIDYYNTRRQQNLMGKFGVYSQVSSMFWHEVRLFACYRKPHPWNKDSTLIYELSSASQVVLWTWVQKKEPLRFSVVPIIPFEQHQAQMRAICDLVAAKTGLPLYDLSTQARAQTRRSHKE